MALTVPPWVRKMERKMYDMPVDLIYVPLSCAQVARILRRSESEIFELRETGDLVPSLSTTYDANESSLWFCPADILGYCVTSSLRRADLNIDMSDIDLFLGDVITEYYDAYEVHPETAPLLVKLLWKFGSTRERLDILFTSLLHHNMEREVRESFLEWKFSGWPLENKFSELYKIPLWNLVGQ